MAKKNTLLNIVASFAIFMEMLDSTILNTAIPTMAESLHVSPINLKIALISYLLMLAIFIPISGWAADKWGAKKVFLWAMAVFTVSSLTSGLAQSLPDLIIMRCFQGIGGAFMVPIARLLLIRSVARHEIVKMMGKVMTFSSLGIMLGPVLGGIITEYLSWRWVFFINVPVGLIAIVLTWRGLESVETVKVHRFDMLGFILFGFGLALFIFGLSVLSEQGISFEYAICALSVAIGLLIGYVVHAKRREDTVINLQLFKFHSFQIAVFGSLLARIGFGGMPFLMPLLFQIGFGYTPAQAGLLLIPMALGVMTAKIGVAGLLNKLGYRNYLVLNTIIVSFVIASFSLLTIHTAWPIILVLVFILGMLFSQQYSGMNSLAYQELKHHELSSATSFMGTLQQFSQSLGVAVAALLLYINLYFAHSVHITPTTFKSTFLILGLITLLSIGIFFRLQPNEFHVKLNKAV